MSLRSLNILVTGGSGFVGAEVIPVLRSAGHRVIAVSRLETFDDADGIGALPPIGEITATDLDSIDVVVHLAGLAHRGKADKASFDEVNHLLAVRLATAASDAGVSRFVLVSTSKVHGSQSSAPINSDSPMVATDGYSESKIAAERSLQPIAGPMTITALRPPLIFGPSAKGNIRLIRSFASRGIPIPVSAKDNTRSFLSRNDFAHAVLAALTIESGEFQGFVLDDRQPMSSREFYGVVAGAEGAKLRLASLPRPVFKLLDRLAALVAGRRPFEASYTDFAFECDAFRKATGWEPRGVAESTHQCRLGSPNIGSDIS